MARPSCDSSGDSIHARDGYPDGDADPTPGGWYNTSGQPKTPLLAPVCRDNAAAVLYRHTQGWSPTSPSFVKNEANGQILYTIKRRWSWTSVIVTEFHRGHSDDNLPSTRRDDSPPYAAVNLTCLRLASDDDKERKMSKVAFKHFSYDERRSWYGIPKVFTVDGREYTLRGPHFADAPISVYRRELEGGGVPLMTFTASHNWQRGGIIFISENSVYTGDDDDAPEDAILVNGRPTRLLDYVLLAEHLFRRRLS